MTLTDLAAIDRELARFRAAADAVSANLLELDADPNRQLLDTAPLAGVTGAAWADARDALTKVWDWFARFTGFLDHASMLRDAPRVRLAPAREHELAAFLTGPSIELAHDDVPLQDRDLLQPRHATSRCTADELFVRMTDSFALARDVVTRVGRAWDDLVPRVSAARGDAVQLPPNDELRTIHEQLDALSDALVADPLSVTGDDVGAVEAAVELLALGARQREDLRRQILDRLRDTRGRLDDLERRTADARRVWDSAQAKVANPAVPSPPVAAPELTSAMHHAADLTDTGRWLDASRALDALVSDLDALTARIDASTESSRAALAQRDHLRGRLDAYRAKAHGLGLDEDEQVTASYERALAALHVAPADLVEATALVTEYQRLLTPMPEPEAHR